jgi:hypothetical protein
MQTGGHLVSFDASLEYRAPRFFDQGYWFLQPELSLGGGFALGLGQLGVLEDGGFVRGKNFYLPYGKIGLGARFFAYRQFFIDAGVDFRALLASNTAGSLYFIRPRLSFGILF